MMFCSKCGKQLAEGAKFCDSCGTPTGQTVPAPRQDTSWQAGLPRAGFSDAINDPVFRKAARKLQKQTNAASFIFLLLPLIGFPAASFIVDDFDFSLAVMTGIFVFFVMLISCMISRHRKKKHPWDGTVVRKNVRKKLNYPDTEKYGRQIYDQYYIVTFRTTAGKEITNTEVMEGRGMNMGGKPVYDGFEIGDKVRYHPAFDYYERYDKSAIKFLQCPICRSYTAIEKSHCDKCGAPLLK